MALENCLGDMATCNRCSCCKFIPFAKVKSAEHTNVCPSIARYEFHTYSGGGRMAMGLALVKKRINYTERLLDAVYNCQLCGACDISCKYGMEMEVLEPLYEIRARCVADGHSNHSFENSIRMLREQGALLSSENIKKGEWADGLKVKYFVREPTEVVYHAGCQVNFNKNFWSQARTTLKLLQKAGIDIAIGGDYESCCGGRAYEMGYQEDFIKQAQKNIELYQKSGVKTIVTGCANCYYAFKVLYDKFHLKGDLKVLHITEYLDQIITEGKLNLSQKLAMNVTYHDPCHLGRLGEPYIHWKGKQIPGHMKLYDPPKVLRRGTYGIYEPPRNILKAVPGLHLIEMDRIKEYAWCCGAGGGVNQSNPEFSQWTASERIDEAESTGAQAIVTACPWCEQNFRLAIAATSSRLKVFDLVEILEKAI
jgi:Fe-S oxidoreductase